MISIKLQGQSSPKLVQMIKRAQDVSIEIGCLLPRGYQENLHHRIPCHLGIIIGAITGEITNEDQPGYIFTKFCIGKSRRFEAVSNESGRVTRKYKL